MVDVFIKPCTRLSNDEYNYRKSLQARAIEGIGIAKCYNGFWIHTSYNIIKYLDFNWEFSEGRRDEKENTLQRGGMEGTDT